MEDHPQLLIQIDPGADFGRLVIGPLSIDWCNPDEFDDTGSFDITWNNYWNLHTGFYKSHDPFTGIKDGDYQFIDWEITKYNNEFKCWKPYLNITNLFYFWTKLFQKI